MTSTATVALNLQPINDLSTLGKLDPAPTAGFDVYIYGVAAESLLEISFWERDDRANGGRRSDRVIGTASGNVAVSRKHLAVMTFVPDKPVPPYPARDASRPKPIIVVFRFPQPKNGSQFYYSFELNPDLAHKHEGDLWKVGLTADNLNLTSPLFIVAHVRRELTMAQATYPSHAGHKLTLFNDGSTDRFGSGGAFFELLQSIKRARKFIFIADWSFHPMFRPSRLGPAAAADSSNSIGAILLQRANSDVLVAIHTWNHTDAGAPDDQNDSGDTYFEHLASPGKRPDTLLWRASSSTQTFSSHHQKFVVMDQPGGPRGCHYLRVFFGGLDLTKGRFDWGDHLIMPNSDAALFLQEWTSPDYVAEHIEERGDHGWKKVPAIGVKANEWYNAEFKDRVDLPREPWHDIHAMVDGPIAWDVLREFTGRWMQDPATSLIFSHGDCSDKHKEKVSTLFRGLFTSADVIQQWEQPDGPFEAQVYRSIMKAHWDTPTEEMIGVDELVGPAGSAAGSTSASLPRKQGKRTELNWHLHEDFEHSIQTAYVQAIGLAEHFVYIENQYFIGAGERWGQKKIRNGVPESLVERIKQRRSDNAPFHVYIVMPMYPEGDPVSGPIAAIRWLEWRTMEWMIQQLGSNWTDNLSFYFLANWEKVQPPSQPRSTSREDQIKARRRYMIYVHSKLMIVDDRHIILGSANLNERSQAGNRDTEIACGLWPRRGREADCVTAIQGLRHNLWTEHLTSAGVPGTWQTPGELTCSSAVESRARKNYLAFRSLRGDGNAGHLCRWPLIRDPEGNVAIEDVVDSVDFGILLPDAADVDDKSERKAWSWSAPGNKTSATLIFTESEIPQ